MRLSGSKPEPSRRPLLAVGLFGLAAGVGAALLLGKAVRAPPEKAAAAAQGLMAGSALLALAVATDSSLEHYRGRFRNRAMFVAPLMSTLTLAAAGQALSGSPRAQSSTGRLVFAGAMASGTAGLAFHVYNVGKREGGFAWLNLFYAAPLGAPAALGHFRLRHAHVRQCPPSRFLQAVSAARVHRSVLPRRPIAARRPIDYR